MLRFCLSLPNDFCFAQVSLPMKRYSFLICHWLLLSTVSLSAWAIGDLLTPFPQVSPAPNFSLHDLQGNAHTLSDYQGKVVVLNFWATWCPPCRAELPSMQRAWEIMRNEDMLMLAVNVGERETTVRQVTQALGLDFPVLLDNNATLMQRWSARGLPTTFVINPQGHIVYRAVGERAWDAPDILRLLRDLKNLPSLDKTALH